MRIYKGYPFLICLILTTCSLTVRAAESIHPLKIFLAKAIDIAALPESEASVKWTELLSTSQGLYKRLAQEPDLYVHIKQCNWGMVASSRADWVKLVSSSVENIKKLFLPKSICTFTSIFNPLINKVGEFALQIAMEDLAKKNRSEIASLLNNDAATTLNKTFLVNLREGINNVNLAEISFVNKIIENIRISSGPAEMREALPLANWIVEYLSHMQVAQKAHLIHDFLLLPEVTKEGQIMALIGDNLGPILQKIFSYIATGDLYIDEGIYKLFNDGIPFQNKSFDFNDPRLLGLKSKLGLEKIYWDDPIKGSTSFVFRANKLGSQGFTETIMIKVLQDGIKEKLDFEYQQLKLINWSASFKNLLEIVYTELAKEINIEQEGKNIDEARLIFANRPNINVPEVLYNQNGVLAMSLAPGTSADRKNETQTGAELKNQYEKIVRVNKHWFENTFFSQPDTLVHSDLHTGNIFFEGQKITFIDWAGAQKVKTADRKALLYFFVATGVKNFQMMARAIVNDPENQREVVNQMSSDFKRIFESSLREEEQFSLIFLSALSHKHTRFKNWFPILRSFIFLQREMDRLALEINKDAKIPVQRSAQWLAQDIGKMIMQHGLPSWLLKNDKSQLFTSRELFASLLKIVASKGIQSCLDLKFWTKFAISQKEPGSR